MKNDQLNGKELDGQDQKVSQKRRQLLQASAVTASLIGTLRSGAALANTSAYQCLENEAASQPTDTQLSGTQRNTAESGWLELTGQKVRYDAVYIGGTGTPPTCTSVYSYFFDSVEYVADTLGENGQYLDHAGHPTSEAVCPDPGDWTLNWNLVNIGDWYAYVYFERLGDYTDISAGPSLLQPSPANNWMALTGSCWSSLGGVG